MTEPPPTVAPGKSFTVSDSVKNVGSVSSGGTTTRYYLSADSRPDGGDRLLTGTRSVAALASGAASNGTVSVTVPGTTPAGSYFVLACADDKYAVTESNEGNNCLASTAQVQIVLPDLVERSMEDPPLSVVRGTGFTVTETVLNRGLGAASISTTRYYLSINTRKDAGDTLLTGSRSVAALAPGATATGSATLTVPSSTSAGDYYLIACADDSGAVVEADETNNCRLSIDKIQIKTAP